MEKLGMRGVSGERGVRREKREMNHICVNIKN